MSEDTAPAPDSEPRDDVGSKGRSSHDVKKKVKKLKDKLNDKGIIYISRIPPHMKPQKLRHLLSEYGDIGRIYLAAEDAGVRKRRKKLGGDSGKNFTEGWVEFEDKRVAKATAAMLNGQQIGGKRRSAHHFDLWCMKYLPKFKWDHLTEEIAYQKAVREQRMAAEISAAKRERDFYLSRVGKAKAEAAQEERRLKRRKLAGEAGDEQAIQGAEPEAIVKPPSLGGVRRTYGQKRTKVDQNDLEAPTLAADVLQLIAGK